MIDIIVYHFPPNFGAQSITHWGKWDNRIMTSSKYQTCNITTRRRIYQSQPRNGFGKGKLKVLEWPVRCQISSSIENHRISWRKLDTVMEIWWNLKMRSSSGLLSSQQSLRTYKTTMASKIPFKFLYSCSIHLEKVLNAWDNKYLNTSQLSMYPRRICISIYLPLPSNNLASPSNHVELCCSSDGWFCPFLSLNLATVVAQLWKARSIIGSWCTLLAWSMPRGSPEEEEKKKNTDNASHNEVLANKLSIAGYCLWAIMVMNFQD